MKKSKQIQSLLVGKTASYPRLTCGSERLMALYYLCRSEWKDGQPQLSQYM